MKETPQHLICWDMDETLGHLAPFLEDMEGKERFNYGEDVLLTYGIQDLLAEFSEKNGYRSVVTTAASRDYAEYALTQAGLIDSFAELYARDVVVPYYEENNRYIGKLYEDVAWYQIPYDDYPNRMVVIGDRVEDDPVDMRDLVHIYSPGIYVDAIVIREAIVALLEAGNGSFKKGFDALSARGINEPINKVGIGNDLELALVRSKGTGPLFEEEGTIPRVYITNIDKFRMQPTVVPQ